MKHRIRLGPIAVFLTVIAIVLVTLATLTVATARADDLLADRFARVTALRYELAAEGERFLAEADAGTLPEGAYESEEGTWVCEKEKDGYRLSVEVQPDTGEVITFKISKIWTEEDPFEDLWQF